MYNDMVAKDAGMAQLVEQRIRNAQVIGSSPITSLKRKDVPSGVLSCIIDETDYPYTEVR